MEKWIIVRGNILNPISDKKCDFYQNGSLVLEKKGKVYKIAALGNESVAKEYLSKKSSKLYDFGPKLIVPGLLDLHFHWVQKDVTSMPKDNLLTWLENYTWPTESNFKSKVYCRKEAKAFTKELLENGTLGGACYGSIHGHSVDMAFEHFVGDFFVGNVLMTMNSPEYLIQSQDDAKKLLLELGKKYKKKYVVTPRFAPTTDEEVMSYGSKIQKKYNTLIQSHLCETLNEIDWVLSIYRERPGFEDVKSYTDIYDRCGLLGEKTIMGHGIYLSEDDLKRLKKTNTAVAHCPTSNAPVSEQGLGSGLFDFEQAEKNKIRWGLGSDIGAGPFVSMLDVMESFVKQNKNNPKATYTKALFRTTQKNAEILGIDEEVGNFELGKRANLVVLDFELNTKIKKAEDILTLFFSQVKERKEFKSKVSQVFVSGLTQL